MQIGKLDRRITLRAQSAALDEYGQRLEVWADVATIWAQYTPDRGGEKTATGEIRASTGAKFRIRYSAQVEAVSALMRLLFEGREYEISQVNEIGRREGLELIATARAE